MKIEPNGRTPPSKMIRDGSRNHFLSGMGRGTAFIRHGLSLCPFTLRPESIRDYIYGNSFLTLPSTFSSNLRISLRSNRDETDLFSNQPNQDGYYIEKREYFVVDVHPLQSLCHKITTHLMHFKRLCIDHSWKFTIIQA